MKHLIKVLVLFALTLVMGKPIPGDWGLVRGTDKVAWTDEGHLINSVTQSGCCCFKSKCCFAERFDMIVLFVSIL